MVILAQLANRFEVDDGDEIASKWKRANLLHSHLLSILLSNGAQSKLNGLWLIGAF